MYSTATQFRKSYLVVAVVVVFGAYSPVTGKHAHRLRGSTPRDDLGRGILLLRTVVPLFAVAGTWAGKSPSVLGDAPPPLDGDALLGEGPSAAPGKGSAGDAASGEDTVGVSKSLLVRSWIWSTNLCAYGSADTPLAFSWLAGILASSK